MGWSTPAYAGITPKQRKIDERQEVYPRVRGDHYFGAHPGDGADGLPPRTRGSRELDLAGGDGGRSTPAYAGITRYS